MKILKIIAIGMLLVFGGLEVSEVVEAQTTTKKKRKKRRKRRKGKKAPKALLNEVADLYKRANYDSFKQAIIKLETAASDYPRDSRVLAYLSQIYGHFTYRDWHFGNKDTTYLEQAEKYARSATRYGKKDYTAFRALGNAHLIRGKRADARTQLETAIKLNGNDAETWYLYACASEGSIVDESTEAGKRMTKALQLDPGFLWALQDRITAYLKKKNAAAARQTFEQLKQKHPAHTDIDYYEGTVLLHEGKTEEARAAFQKYVDKNKDSNLSEYVRLYLSR